MSIKKHRGQAISETIISMSALVVFFLSASTFYVLNQGTVNAAMASRLSIWYQSLYGVGSGLTDVQVNAMAADLVGKVYVEQRHDFSARRSMTSCDTDVDCFVFGRIGAGGGWQHGVTTDALPSVSPTYAYPDSHSTDFANFVGLGNVGINSQQVSIPINPRLSLLEENKLTGSFADYGDPDRGDSGHLKWRFAPPSGGFKITRKAALLSNAFVPVNDEAFQQTISGIASDGAPLAVFEPFRGALQSVGFDEIAPTFATDGMLTTPAKQSTVLPEELGVYVE